MKKLLAGLMLALIASTALAAGTTANISVALPTTYADTTPMPASDVATVTVEWRRVAGGPTVGSKVLTAPTLTGTVPGLACGDYIFDAFITTTATAVFPGQTSANSTNVPYSTKVSCVNPPVVTAS